MSTINKENLLELLNLDYATLRKEALKMKNKYDTLKDWNMENPNDPLGLVLEAYLRAIVKDSNFANLIAQEFSLASSITEDSIFEKAYLAGYNITLRTPAYCTMNLEVTAGNNYIIAPYELVIKGTSKSGGTVYFENLNQINIPTNASTTIMEDIEFVEGRTKQITRIGDGNSFQSILIQDTVLDGTVSLKVNNIEWEQVFSINGQAQEDDLYYELRRVGLGVYQIICGDGINGSVFPKGSKIEITYRSGVGSDGNVLTYYIDTIFSTPTPRVTRPIFQEIFDRASGGQDQEDLEKVKTLAPKISKMNGVIGNRWDMDIYINSYPGVGTGKSKELGFNTFRVYIANEEGYPTDYFKDQMKQDIEDRLIIGASVDIQNAVKKPTNLKLDIIYDLSYSKGQIEIEITDKFLDFLNPFTYSEDSDKKLSFGTDLLISDIYEIVTAVEGVIAVSILEPIPATDIILINILDNEILTQDGSTISLNMTPSTETNKLKANKSEKWFFNNPLYK